MWFRSPFPIAKCSVLTIKPALEILEGRLLPSLPPHILAVLDNQGSFPHSLLVLGGAAYFVANDGDHGEELWVTDGTAAGTLLVKDINPGTDSSNPSDLT